MTALALLLLLCWLVPAGAGGAEDAADEAELGPPSGTLLIVDRLEGATAVVEAPSGVTWTVPAARLGPGVREGDAVRWTPGRAEAAPAESSRLRARTAALARALARAPPLASGLARGRQR